jgi:hypothetical protein
MADMDRFEARLAASLERLADEVPTRVDAAELTATIAAAEGRRGWPLTRTRDRRRAPALRVALVLAAILALVFGMIALAPRLVRTPFAPMSHGSMTCAGAPAITGAGPVTLECVAELPDSRLAGDALITLGAAADVGGVAVRPGTMELGAADATWRGTLELTTAPNGVSAGDAVLEGSGGAAGIVLRLHILSAGGTEWGLLGWVEAGP